MNGVPLRIWRDGAFETVYLGTIRAGALAEKLRKLKSTYYLAADEETAQLKLVAMLPRAAKEESTAEELIALSVRQDDAIRKSRECHDAAVLCAEEIVRISLTICHGEDEADAIMDCLNDQQILKCIAIMAGGEQPADFFGSRDIDTPPGGNGTGQPDAAKDESLALPPTVASVEPPGQI